MGSNKLVDVQQSLGIHKVSQLTNICLLIYCWYGQYKNERYSKSLQCGLGKSNAEDVRVGKNC